jgi:hypothetical protein
MNRLPLAFPGCGPLSWGFWVSEVSGEWPTREFFNVSPPSGLWKCPFDAAEFGAPNGGNEEATPRAVDAARRAAPFDRGPLHLCVEAPLGRCADLADCRRKTTSPADREWQ